MAARERPGRRDHPGRRPRGPRPGHAAVPRQRPGRRAGPGRLANRLEGRDHPGLPAGWAPAVFSRLKPVTWATQRRPTGSPPTVAEPRRRCEMQYLVSVIHDTSDLATSDEMAAIDVFNDRLQTKGHWVFAG